MRQRILVANSNVTEPMKLCNRTRSALDYLLKCKNLTTVREALLHLGKILSRMAFVICHSIHVYMHEIEYQDKISLNISFHLTEVASRLSHKCTEQLVLDNALSVIFKVVRDSNRSLAHMGLIKLALDIFINVSKV